MSILNGLSTALLPYFKFLFFLQLAPFDFRQQTENLGRRLGRVGGLHSLGAEQSPGRAIRGGKGGQQMRLVSQCHAFFSQIGRPMFASSGIPSD